MHQRYRITLITAALLCTGLLSVWLLSARVQTESPSVTPSPTVSSEATAPTPGELLKLVNEERAKVGVAPLVLRDELNAAAQLKADDMFKRNYYNHVDPDGKHGYMYAYEALRAECQTPSENLTNANDNSNTANDIVTGWVKSPAHYDAMVSPKYTITGFGISGNYTVEHFC